MFKKESVLLDTSTNQNGEISKLNQEIEFLKLQLQDEKNNNTKLNDELLKVKSN